MNCLKSLVDYNLNLKCAILAMITESFDQHHKSVKRPIK